MKNDTLEKEYQIKQVMNKYHHLFIKFISYKSQSLSRCLGVLTLDINGQQITFGNDEGENYGTFFTGDIFDAYMKYPCPLNYDYPRFWEPKPDGERQKKIIITEEGDNISYFPNHDFWEIKDINLIPQYLQFVSDLLLQVLNENTPNDHCGGCDL